MQQKYWAASSIESWRTHTTLAIQISPLFDTPEQATAWADRNYPTGRYSDGGTIIIENAVLPDKVL